MHALRKDAPVEKQKAAPETPAVRVEEQPPLFDGVPTMLTVAREKPRRKVLAFLSLMPTEARPAFRRVARYTHPGTG
jgi:L-amino acid N-acyltransferase YncA